MELFLDTGWLVHIAMLGYVTGFLFRNQIILRILVLCGTAFYISYYYLHPSEPLWGAIFASFMIMGANLIGLGRILYSKMMFGITSEHRPVFAAMAGLEPGEFRRLMRIGEFHIAESAEVLTRENEDSDSLFFVVHGTLRAEKEGRRFAIPNKMFIGEIGFVLHRTATATVRLATGGTYIRWDKKALRTALDESASLERAFEALLGRDMARKVSAGVRVYSDDLIAA